MTQRSWPCPVNGALPDTGLLQGHLPCSGQWVRSLGTVPLALGTLAVLIVSLGPQCVAVRMQREDGRAGGLSPHGICLGLRSWMLCACGVWSRMGSPGVKAPILPLSPSSCSSTSPKNHFEDHSIHHELYYGRLFFMLKNKFWHPELYLVYGSLLHINVLKGQLLY